jgi:CRP/FNR family transcriptional regulator
MQDSEPPTAKRVALFPVLSCATCVVRDRCFIRDLDPEQAAGFERLIGRRRRILRGEYAYREDDAFTNLVVVRTGSFKTELGCAEGNVEVAGFHQAGDILALESVISPVYKSEAIALEDSVVCEVPFSELEALAMETPLLNRELIRRLRDAALRNQRQMLLLKKRSEQRFAAFLCDLSAGATRRGGLANKFRLQMSRADISHYLGLSNASTSRLIARFTQAGLITIRIRQVQILDPRTLEQLACNMLSWEQCQGRAAGQGA